MTKEHNEMVERPDVKKRMAEFGLTILPAEQRTPEYLASFLPKDIALGQGDPRCGVGGHGGQVMLRVRSSLCGTLSCSARSWECPIWCRIPRGRRLRDATRTAF